LPVKRVRGDRHFIADLMLPYGRVLHDNHVATAVTSTLSARPHR
jgi:hypothetical protein